MYREINFVKFHGLPLFYDLQVETFKSSYYSSYFWVKMVEKKPCISPSGFNHFARYLQELYIIVCCSENCEFYILAVFLSYLPTPPLGQDMTQGQFLSGV